jgi:hypothetical protein
MVICAMNVPSSGMGGENCCVKLMALILFAATGVPGFEEAKRKGAFCGELVFELGTVVKFEDDTDEVTVTSDVTVIGVNVVKGPAWMGLVEPAGIFTCPDTG